MEEVHCSDSVDNLSDHLPLFFSLALSYLPSQNVTTGVSSNRPTPFAPSSHPRINWDNVSSDHIITYCNCIEDNIPSLPIEVLSCCNPSCKCHYSILDDVCSQLLHCIEYAAHTSLPKITVNSRRVPGWNNAARSLHQTASFWHKLWCDCGHPTSGVLFQIKKNTKKRFKYEVCRLRRKREHIIREKLGIALTKSCHKNFWNEVRKVTKLSKGCP